MIIFISESETNMKKLSWKEIVWYVISGVFAFGGLILITFGIFGHHMNVPLNENFIKTAENALIKALNIPFDFRIWGIIFLFVGLVIAIITLNIHAKKVDREVEKTIRRQQRLNAGLNEEIAVKFAVEIVEENKENA